MLNNKLIIAIVAIILVIGLVVGGVLIFTNKDDQPDTPDNTDTTNPNETNPPDIDVPSDTVKVEDETKPGISSTPFVDIEEGNEIYFDADVVEKLSLLHEEGDEDLVNGMLDWISGFINYFASKGYSHTAICQIQRLFIITSEDMMELDFDIACLNITRCIPATGASESSFENDVFKAFEWTTPYDYSYVFEVEVSE